MRWVVEHESPQRLRVRAQMPAMSGAYADTLEAYLTSIAGITGVRVDERTANACIGFERGRRDTVVEALRSFDPEAVEQVEFSSRELSRHYEDKMFWHVVRRGITRFVLPLPARTIVNIVKAAPFVIRALRRLVKRELTVETLDATSIVVALIRGDYDTAGSVMFLLGMGDIMEEWTHRKSVQDLAGAMALNVEKVWLRDADGQEVLTAINDVNVGDTVMVRTGHMIPLDGTVIEGDAMVNQSSITGEPLPIHKYEESLVYAGTVVDEGQIAISVREKAGSGRYDRIVNMIEESEKLKSGSEVRAARLADKLVPWTFGATGLTWLLTQDTARAASILMVDFCCALKLSMPIAVLSAMRQAGTQHITVKGGKFLENFAEAETIVFDKTGTLTDAAPRVHAIELFGDYEEKEILRLAACLEEHYPHSIANAVVAEAAARGLVHEEEHSKVDYIVAHGIASSIDGKKVRIGSRHFIFEDEKCTVPRGTKRRFNALPGEYSHLYMALEDKLAAVILIEDPIKAQAGQVIEQLRGMGLTKAVMMTGDSAKTADSVARMVGVDEHMAEVLPEDKAAFIRREHEAGRKVIMVGDGVNDSPALSEADCGVAINSGAAIAREIADITISEGDLEALVTLRAMSQSLMRRINTNYRTIISFNSFLILMGVLGIFPSQTTALLHNTSTIAISLKSMTDLNY